MLPKQNCLKKKKDFEKVFKKGRSYREDFLYLKFLPNTLKTSRFGFVVSKKFSNKATVRNKMKRQLREIVKIILPKIKKSIDAVVVVIPGIKTKDFWGTEELADKLFKKSRII